MKPHKRHRLLGFLATMFALLALAGAAARALPADLQELPFAPIVVSATPWFTLLGLIALLLAIVSRRILAALIAIAAIACNGYWQYPFFYSTDPLPQAAQNAVAAASPNTSDAYARVMTFNVYKGQADPQAIVELVRDQRVEVLALQETTEDFVKNSMRLVLSIICRMRRSHRLTAYSVTASGRPRHLPIRPTMT
ncbi:endonuclease/exonuclease/phosphatase domain protein [Bifidobacterium longum subsp. longum 2-2B]|uniref:Endonuclease/exonuclease/phosphatase domain protein n=1 Tax=Bifidobacterium longum subsp. longum 2-2B TaxID=1161745 RepID=A0AAV3FIV3_BIFLL|nr:endonuclease/exonuclease/phosphatase domain protein [Bifidobacterium longum subsp. longum 2-2B]